MFGTRRTRRAQSQFKMFSDPIGREWRALGEADTGECRVPCLIKPAIFFTPISPELLVLHQVMKPLQVEEQVTVAVVRQNELPDKLRWGVLVQPRKAAQRRQHEFDVNESQSVEVEFSEDLFDFLLTGLEIGCKFVLLVQALRSTHH